MTNYAIQRPDGTLIVDTQVMTTEVDAWNYAEDLFGRFRATLQEHDYTCVPVVCLVEDQK